MNGHPLQDVCKVWLEKIKLAWDFKRKHFQNDADEAMRFYCGPYDSMYGVGRGPKAFRYVGGENDDFTAPSFRMTYNRIAELVQIFGPALYHRNPIRQVNPRKPPMLPVELLGDPNDPNVQMMIQQAMQQEGMMRTVDKARAVLIEQYLNYTPTALNLKEESRWAIDEALIKGMGCLFTELYTPAGSTRKMVGSFYRTVDDLLIDPDVELMRDCKWIAIRCVHPHWEVEEEYGLPEGSLKKAAADESTSQRSRNNSSKDGNYNRARGDTNDLVVYWKVYSKMGMGGRLKGANKAKRTELDAFGQYCYLVLAQGIEYPLNLPDSVTAMEGTDSEIKSRLEWPTPFWADDAWPVTSIAFHSVPRNPWPMSHIKPAIGELMFLNWAYSMLASKIRIACRDFIGVLKSASEDVKSQIRSAGDYTIIEIEAIHQSIDKAVQFLQHPTFNPEIYRVIEGVTKNFEQRTGLSELVYGMSGTQMRSAQEAGVKGQQISVRPDDMANKVEDSMTECARKEALAARWHLTGQDVLPVLGQMGAQYWDQFVVPSDPGEILHQLEYRIEANSARKPNLDKTQADMAQSVQTLGPILQGVAQSGQVEPLNNLLQDWCRSMQLSEPERYAIQPPSPPPVAPAPAPGPEGAPA